VNAPGTTELETPPGGVAPIPAGANGDHRGAGDSEEVRAGYLFWGVTIGVILLVELLGALGGWLEDHIGVHVPWTTISGMVGHLEDLWPATAVIVVAIIAPAAFYALGPVGRPPDEIGALRRNSSGRWKVGDANEDESEKGYPPWFVFAVCFGAAVAAILFLDDDFFRAYLIYGTLFVFGILVPSVIVLTTSKRKVGFTSLFVTVEHLRDRRDVLAVLATVALSAGLAVLVIHLAFYPWPDITKAPVEYAGLTANGARSKAKREVTKPGLRYSTQARGVVNAQEAWLVFFTASDGADSGCVVTLTETDGVALTDQCKA
jgi:hypothetical protein